MPEANSLSWNLKPDPVVEGYAYASAHDAGFSYEGAENFSLARLYVSGIYVDLHMHKSDQTLFLRKMKAWVKEMETAWE